MTDYQEVINNAMLDVLKRVLTYVQRDGLSGDHLLYISFMTQDPLVILSDRMKRHYPQEMTIVLQHQFDNLVVEAGYFSIGLSFHGIYEVVRVPFRAITSFVSPSIKLSFSFKTTFSKLSYDINTKPIESALVKTVDSEQQHDATQEMSNVIALDKFRKKKQS